MTGRVRIEVCPFCEADLEDVRTMDHLKICYRFFEEWGPEGAEPPGYVRGPDVPSLRG